ncbi:hypothetical protein [Streptomyces sp. LBL]|uniref:MmyB family transcriptional regulator n=1 Tax=Streptomyces sp. LBL TaxID=2940562 RepID=UPI0024738DD1|nr:hypothetical protein [Streptomyces sp. LBL]
MVFQDAHPRDLFVDWRKKARDVVGKLRLAALIGELTMRRPEFAAMSSEHKVRKWDFATYRMHHPLVGPMYPTPQTLPIPQETGPTHRGRNCRSDSPSHAPHPLPTRAPTSSVSGTLKDPGSSRGLERWKR